MKNLLYGDETNTVRSSSPYTYNVLGSQKVESKREQAVYKRTKFIIISDGIHIDNTISCARVIMNILHENKPNEIQAIVSYDIFEDFNLASSSVGKVFYKWKGRWFESTLVKL